MLKISNGDIPATGHPIHFGVGPVRYMTISVHGVDHFGTFSNTGVNNDLHGRYIFKYYITILCSHPIPDLYNAPNNSSTHVVGHHAQT